MIEKQNAYRNAKWLDAVRSIDTCVLCGKHGTQAAHRNESKGIGMKSSDCLTAALCPECHHEIDHGKEMCRDDRRAMMDRAIVLTLEKLVKAGKVKV